MRENEERESRDRLARPPAAVCRGRRSNRVETIESDSSSLDEQSDSNGEDPYEDNPAAQLNEGEVASSPPERLCALGRAWLACAQLTKLLFTAEIADMDVYCANVQRTVVEMIAAFDVLFGAQRNKRKFKLHLLVHASDIIRRFGPL